MFALNKWTEFKRTVERPSIETQNLGNFERNSNSILYNIKWIPRLDRTLPMYKDNCTISLKEWEKNGRPKARIPKIVHFIYGLKPPSNENP